VHRGSSADFLVVVGNCTHLGCIPTQEVKRGRSLMGEWWPGGFTCARHGSVYDYAGRVVRGPAPRNLRVPPYYFASANTIVIGVSESDV
jgi:ubiquinol-cytochrome c reductase iron-sulfur subunit